MFLGLVNDCSRLFGMVRMPNNKDAVLLRLDLVFRFDSSGCVKEYQVVHD